MSVIMRIKDERETKNKQTKTEKNNGCVGGSYSERVKAKWFCYAFKLDFLQLIWKASLIFKLNLELALSIVLKERIKSKHLVVECRCLKIWDLYILFHIFLNPSFKMMTSLANIARATASTSNFIY